MDKNVSIIKFTFVTNFRAVHKNSIPLAAMDYDNVCIEIYWSPACVLWLQQAIVAETTLYILSSNLIVSVLLPQNGEKKR